MAARCAATLAATGTASKRGEPCRRFPPFALIASTGRAPPAIVEPAYPAEAVRAWAAVPQSPWLVLEAAYSPATQTWLGLEGSTLTAE